MVINRNRTTEQTNTHEVDAGIALDIVSAANQECNPVTLALEAIMYNLGLLENRINSDPAFRRQFFDDPVGVLRKEGMLLSLSQESALKDTVTKMRAASAVDSSLNRRTIGFTWFLK